MCFFKFFDFASSSSSLKLLLKKDRNSRYRRQSLRLELPSAEPDGEKDNGFPDVEPFDLRPTIPEVKGRDRDVRERGDIEHRIPSNPGRPVVRYRQMPSAVRDSATLASHHTPDQNYLAQLAVLQHPGEDRESVQGAQQSDNHHLSGLHKLRRAFRRWDEKVHGKVRRVHTKLQKLHRVVRPGNPPQLTYSSSNPYSDQENLPLSRCKHPFSRREPSPSYLKFSPRVHWATIKRRVQSWILGQEPLGGNRTTPSPLPGGSNNNTRLQLILSSFNRCTSLQSCPSLMPPTRSVNGIRTRIGWIE